MHKVVPIQQKKNNRLPNERDLPPSKQSEFYNTIVDDYENFLSSRIFFEELPKEITTAPIHKVPLYRLSNHQQF